MNDVESLLRLNLTRQLRSKRWALALVLFLLIFGAGVRFTDDKYDTFGDGLVIAAVVAISFGIAQDRRTGFDLFLSNLVTPGAAVVARIVAVFSLYMALFALALLAAALVWREPALALWYTAHIFLVLALVGPLSFLIEIAFAIEIPAVLAMLLFALFMMYFTLSGPEGSLPQRIAFMGLDVTPGKFASLGRLLQVNLSWNVFVVILSIGTLHYQNRRKRIRPSV